MKLVTFVSFFVALGCVYLRADSSPLSPNISELPANIYPMYYDEEIIISDQHDDGCYEKRCFRNGTHRCVSIRHKTCSTGVCYEGQIGYEPGDFSKPFPQCCGRLICSGPLV